MKETYIRTGIEEIDNLLPMIRSFLEKDLLVTNIDGVEIRGYRTPDAKSIWIRDYSDMMRGTRYFEKDMKSVVDHFAENQSDKGRIFDYFTTFPEKLPCERENWTKYVRVPVEADVEFRFVKAAWLAWQASGDDEWICTLLPKMEKALEYIMNNPLYWDRNSGLVKRAYTIDTWDFAYTAGKHPWLQFQIDDDTFWGIMHGDNSGYYEAFTIMATLWDYFGESSQSVKWKQRALTIKESTNDKCWNGDFYTHFVKLGYFTIHGVDESRQLSLSNPMDINRGLTTPPMASSIIEEYIKRGKASDSFAEWFSIDPPFPDGIFGDEKLISGAYCNGGIMPLVGGELAKAAFENGYESYGVEILRKYNELISKNGETYLWYFPDGEPAGIDTSTSPEAEPTDAWGSTAMLYALTEGLAGIEDKLKGFSQIRFSPRWPAAGIEKAEVCLKYTASDTFFAYNYSSNRESIRIEMESAGSDVQFNILVPDGKQPVETKLDGEKIKFEVNKTNNSSYLGFDHFIKGNQVVEILLK